MLETPTSRYFGLETPIFLAGMNVVANPRLAAAVSNAGGMGCWGGVFYTPEMLSEKIDDLKAQLEPGKKFGVDLLLPQVGGSARKTNYDYTGGKLGELVDIIIAKGASLFISAVGVPPPEIVEKFHKAGIPVMNMVGHVKHVQKALECGVDFICAQGGEGGGHTGHVPTSVLIPQVVEAVNRSGRRSSVTGMPVKVIAAGGIYNGKSLAAALAMGAEAVWVGTRFVACKESGAPKEHIEAVLSAKSDDIVKTLIYTGRPLNVRKTRYIEQWETERQNEIRELTAKGILPFVHDLEANPELDEAELRPWLMGQVAAAIHDVPTAAEILRSMTAEAEQCLASLDSLKSRL